MLNKLRAKLVEKALGLLNAFLTGNFDGYKTFLAVILNALAQFVPGFPVIDVAAGLTLEQLLLLQGLLHKLVKKVRGK